MTEAFEPRNDLEHRLLQAQEGEIGAELFLEGLLSAQVFMPVRDDDLGISGLQRSARAVPLTLPGADGGEILVLFTSPERARPFLADHPDFKGGLLMEFQRILEKVGSGVGVVLNPGWPVGLDMAAEQVAQLARH